MTLKIYSVMSTKGVRYYVEHPEGRLHILNERSLVWNLKSVFGVGPDIIKGALEILATGQGAQITLKQVS